MRATCPWRGTSSDGSSRSVPGETYSREKLQATAKAISDRLGTEGYAFANVNIVPEIDREKHEAAFAIYVDPGRRVYIRKINISGNARTRDEIIRREMRQLESAWYDGARIDRSKVRIRRLGYFDDVKIETPPVPGTTDQADVEVTVVEKATGTLQAGVGYSSSDGLVLSASVSQQNIFGTGNALTAGDQHEQDQPHDLARVHRALLDRGWHLADVRALLPDHRPRLAADLAVRIQDAGRRGRLRRPDQRDRQVNVGLRVEHTDLSLFDNSPPLYYDFVREFGSSTNTLHPVGGVVA